jgi:hypothetical protein
MRTRVSRRILLAALPAVAVLVAIVVARLSRVSFSHEVRERRAALFAALRPVKLSNCQLKRFGHPHDGGYLLCDNLLDRVQAVYSYGIEGRDEWGCEVAQRGGVTTHQYDCFDLRRPRCEGASTVFHEECVAARPFQSGGKTFDTLAHQIAANGDEKKRLVAKVDVEGAELLENIDQLLVEFHDYDTPGALEVIERLKKVFHVVNVHFNNNTCTWFTQPLPAYAFEVLFVRRGVGLPDPSGAPPAMPQPLDSRNLWQLPDCQARW